MALLRSGLDELPERPPVARQTLRAGGQILRTLRQDAQTPECGVGLAEPDGERLDAQGNVRRADWIVRRLGERIAPGMVLPVRADGDDLPVFLDGVRRLAAHRHALLRPRRADALPRPRGGELIRRRPRADPSLLRPEEAGTWDATAIDLELQLTFGYRTVAFTVELMWAVGYGIDLLQLRDDARFDPDDDTGRGVSEGEVTSIDDTLEILWAPLHDAARGSRQTFHSLIGCYNLPREPCVDELFWMGWWGGPHEVAIRALQLIYTYWEHIEFRLDTLDGEMGDCEGLPWFVHELLAGKEVQNSETLKWTSSYQKCYLSLNFRNVDEDYPNPVNEPCRYKKRSCDMGFSEEKARGWDWNAFDNDLAWVSASRCYSGRGDDEDCPPDETPKGLPLAIGGTSYQITTHPTRLAFLGFLTDQQLTIARLAMDYSFHLVNDGDLSGLYYLLDAKHVARYALRVIAELARLLIHELGHVYMGGGHCSHDCCFDNASYHWLCKVRGELGLAQDPYAPNRSADGLGDDWAGSNYFQRNIRPGCSIDDGVKHDRIVQSCNTNWNGRSGENATYCSYGCRDRYSEMAQILLLERGCTL